MRLFFRFTTLLLCLLTYAVSAQVSFRPDTTARNFRTGEYGLAIYPGGVMYALPKTGPALLVSGIRSINGLSASSIILGTDQISEGSNNLYFTTARARATLSASGPLTYNATTGQIGFTSLALSGLSASGASVGQAPVWNGTAWVPGNVASSGEANTGANIGTGVGVFGSKVGVELRFKTIRSLSNRLSLTDNTGNNTLDLDVNPANITLPATQITGLATVATSNAYADLTGKPTLSTVAGTGAYGDLTGKPTLSTVASTGGYNDLTGRPTLSTVATSGAYTDLSGRPTLGTGAALNVAASGNAATGELVRGNDTRLADARPPTTHVHPIADVTGLQTALDTKAPLASPALTGTPTVPNPATNDNSTQVPNTSWVRSWVQAQGFASGSGAGETNTASNVNTAGVGVYQAKTGVNLEFKGIAPASGRVTVVNNTTNKTIDLDVNEGGLTLAQSQITGLASALSGKEPTITAGTSSQVILGNKTLGTLAPGLVGLGNLSNSLQVVNAGGAVSMASGTLASRPTAGIAGRFYYATDNNTAYYDNGSAWAIQQTAITGDVNVSAGGGVATLPTVNANVGTFGSATSVPVVTANAKGQITSVTTSAITPAGIGAEPALTVGTTGQVLLGNKTLGTLNPALVGLPNVPNLDATNAANISAGTLSVARLPALTGDATTTAGTAAVTVARIRGVNVSTTAPTNGQILQYNNSTTQYEPATLGGGAPSGSAGGSLAGTYPNPTLASSGVTAAAYTYANVTVNAEGRITAASNGATPVLASAAGAASGVATLDANSRVPVGQLANLIADGATVTTTTWSSNQINSQISAVSTTDRNRTNHTGTQLASTISDFSSAADARITVQKAAASGVASLDANTKLPFAQLPAGGQRTVITATYTLQADDCNRTIEFTVACTATVPANLITSGCNVNLIKTGSGDVAVAAGASMTVNSADGMLKITKQWGMATIYFRTSSTAVLGGNISN